MSRKDELADQVSHLKALLEKESERNSSLTNELTEVRKKSAETNDKAQARIQTLTRENDLLKHQLKKYVSAVMKLRDGPQVNISISILMEEVCNWSNDKMKPPIPPQSKAMIFHGVLLVKKTLYMNAHSLFSLRLMRHWPSWKGVTTRL